MARYKPKGSGYRSGYESRVARFLAENGVAFEYEKLTLSYLLPIRGAKCNPCGSTDIATSRTYTPDFCLTANGVIIEAKGRFTSLDRTKMASVKRAHPDLDIRILFECDNWITKRRKMRYSGWADKHGFPWAVSKLGRCPEGWLK